ncbi:MAG: DUF255 domain-containing protein [Pirellulales bacterium]|nr:DUF255 domain-containing protein [Pirellulales bacterium]
MPYILHRYGLAVTLGLFCSTLLAEQSLPWESSLENAQRQAAPTQRLIYLHFWAPWCGPCQRMETEVFRQDAVMAQLTANYVPVKINADQFPQVAHQFAVTGLPTDVILTPQGQVLQSFYGRTDAASFVARLNQVAAAYRQQTGAALVQNPNGRLPGAGSPPPAGSETTTAAMPALTPPPRVPEPKLVAPAPLYGQPAAPNSTPPERRPALSAAAPGVESATAVSSPPPAAPALQLSNAPVNPPANAASPGGSPPPLSPPPAAAVANPPKALDEYCPVSLMEKQQWIPGDKRYGMIHRGRTYLFAGPEEQYRFSRAPDLYAPVNSGYDVVLAVEQGKNVTGSRAHGVYFADRIFLFANEANLARFSANPAYYAQYVLAELQPPPSAPPPLR